MPDACTCLKYKQNCRQGQILPLHVQFRPFMLSMLSMFRHVPILFNLCSQSLNKNKHAFNWLEHAERAEYAAAPQFIFRKWSSGTAACFLHVLRGSGHVRSCSVSCFGLKHKHVQILFFHVQKHHFHVQACSGCSACLDQLKAYL